MSSTPLKLVLALAGSSCALAQAPTRIALPRDSHWTGAVDGRAQIGNGRVHTIVAPGHATVTGPTYTSPPRPLDWWVVDRAGKRQQEIQWQYHRPAGLPFVRLCGEAPDRGIETLWFCDATLPRTWVIATSTGRIELALAARGLSDTTPSAPGLRQVRAFCIETESGRLLACSAEDAVAAAAAAIRSWRERTADTLELRSSDARIDDLVDAWKVQLFTQQCAITGRIVPMMGTRTATARSVSGAVLGLLRLGCFEEAGRALDAFVEVSAATGCVPTRIDVSPGRTTDSARAKESRQWSELEVTPDALWLVLAHHWHWRASGGDTARIRRHWGFLEAVVKRQQRHEGVLLDPAEAIGPSVRFTLCLQSMAAMRDALTSDAEGTSPGRPWLMSFGRRLGEIDAAFWDRKAHGYREATGSAAPVGSLAPAALGLFTGGGKYERNAAAAAARYASSESPVVLGQLVYMHGQRKDAGRNDTLGRLIDGVRPAGDWRTSAPFDPGVGGHNLDALLFGLTGARTTAWGAPPPRILPLTLYLPEFLTWFEVRNLARDGWRIDLSIGAEHRPLTTDEYDALQTHPIFANSERADEHRLFDFEIRLLTEDPPAGAWQASVSVAGTSFQRYLSQQGPVHEVEVWDGGARQPWPRPTRR